MQVATVSTSRPTVRSAIHGWTFEDTALLVRQTASQVPAVGAEKIFIGYTPSPKNMPDYAYVLEMLADGWELLGPPQHEEWKIDGKRHEDWSWWLQRKPQELK